MLMTFVAQLELKHLPIYSRNLLQLTKSLHCRCGLLYVCFLSAVLWYFTYHNCYLAQCIWFLANVNSSSRSLYVVVRPSSVCLSSVTFVCPTQAIEIFGNVFTPFGTLAIRDLCVKILRRSSQGNPSGGGLNRRGVAKYSNFGPFQGYISETMQDRR